MGKIRVPMRIICGEMVSGIAIDRKIGGWFPHAKPILQLPDEDFVVIEPEVPKMKKIARK